MDINGYINVVAKDLCYLKKDISKIEDIANLIIAQSLLGAKVYIIGNGGSASTASHFAQGLCDAGINAMSFDNMACFPRGTKVITQKKVKRGGNKEYDALLSRPIESIRMGDFVLSYNGTKKELRSVTKIFKRKAENFIKLTFSNGNYLWCTEEHPIAINLKGKIECIKASDLTIGSKCLQYNYPGLSLRLRKFDVWNKGLTAENDLRVRTNVTAAHNKLRNLYDKGEYSPHNKSLSMIDEYGESRAADIKKRDGDFRRDKTYEELYGEKKAKDLRELCSVVGRNRWKDTKFREKQMTMMNSKEWIDKQSKSHIGQINPIKDLTYDEYYGDEKSKEVRTNQSCAKFKNWRDPKYAAMMLKAQGKKPNEHEIAMSYFLRHLCPGKFKMNVDGHVTKEYNLDVDGLVPDFIWPDGGKIIQYNGCNWHACSECGGHHPRGISDEDIRERDANVLKRLVSKGWQVLIVWEHERANINKLHSKVENFIFNPNVENVELISKEYDYRKGVVYNLEVEGNNNYFAQGILVHNCLTALANDLGYENIFSNQLKNILSPDDVVIGISGSGNSPNIVKAIELANKMGCITICLLGFDGGKLKDIAQKFIHVKDDNYGRIEDVHLSLAHIISLYIKDAKKND